MNTFARGAKVRAPEVSAGTTPELEPNITVGEAIFVAIDIAYQNGLTREQFLRLVNAGCEAYSKARTQRED